ncbi:hypothetical protein ACO0RG_003501 [Hanseniaspora osmophila]|uniref:Uncharacterized protein n=1 Tax=Hanseniaspora osmophila TaxID=56408 RepID=A0A1E5RDZ0_9ASCO|nr:hypothetical protein AWRI3579_g2140 [Hanseniaspora osmophila]
MSTILNNTDNNTTMQPPSFYKNTNDSTQGSSSSFFQSFPVDLTTVKGYLEFIQKKGGPSKVITEFNEDKSGGVVLNGKGDKIATVSGEAMEYLIKLAS